jgi:hypothetical protein
MISEDLRAERDPLFPRPLLVHRFRPLPVVEEQFWGRAGRIIPSGLPMNPFLVAAHPGHELVVYGWLEHARPRVFVFTDGSGGSGTSRLGHSHDILSTIGASAGSIFGRATDRDMYSMILHGRTEFFVDLAGELAAAITEHKPPYVVTDPIEGYNPVHDLCAPIAAAAIELATAAGARTIAQFEFSMHPPHDGRPGTTTRELSAGAVARKRAALNGYEPLRLEFEARTAAYGDALIRRESFTRVHSGSRETTFPNGQPDYERTGRERVADGRYSRLITYDEHVRPIIDALSERVSQGVARWALSAS